MKEDKDDSNSSLVRISCHFAKDEIAEKIKKTKNKKLVKLFLSDMKNSVMGRSNLNQQIFTLYNKRLHLINITIAEHKPNPRYNRYHFEFTDLLNGQSYYLNLEFLDGLYFQNDVEEILIKNYWASEL